MNNITLQTNFVKACLAIDERGNDRPYVQVKITKHGTTYEATNGITCLVLTDEAYDPTAKEGEYSFTFKQLNELVKEKRYTIQATPEDVYGHFRVDSIEELHSSNKAPLDEIGLNLNQLDKIRKAFKYIRPHGQVKIEFAEGVKPQKVTCQDDTGLVAYIMPVRL